MSTKSLLKDHMRDYIPVIILGAIFLLMNILTKGLTSSPRNITMILFQNSYYIVLALGMLFIIRDGKIDLSVGSQMTFAGVVFYIFAIKMNMGTIPAILFCLIAGAIIGALQGLLIAYLKLPSFAVTIVAMLGIRYLAPVFLEGTAVAIEDMEFLHAMNQTLPVQLTIVVGLIISVIYLLLEFLCYTKTLPLPVISIKAFLILAGIGILTYSFSLDKGIPYIFLIIAILIAFFSFVLEKVNTAKPIQVPNNTQRRIFLEFINMGVLSAVAGILFIGRIGAISTFAGNKFEISVILACLIGGASIARHLGKVRGVVIGVLIYGVMVNGLMLVNISVYTQNIIIYMFLAFAAALEIYLKIKDNKKQKAGAGTVSINP